MQLQPTNTVTATSPACLGWDQGSRDRPGHVTPRIRQQACASVLPLAGWHSPLPCAALGPSPRRRGSCSEEVHDRRPGPTDVLVEEGWSLSYSVPFAAEGQVSRLGLSRVTLQREGRPQPHPASHGRPARAQSELVKTLWLTFSCFLFALKLLSGMDMSLAHPGLPEPSRVPASFRHGLLPPPSPATASCFCQFWGLRASALGRVHRATLP